MGSGNQSVEIQTVHATNIGPISPSAELNVPEGELVGGSRVIREAVNNNFLDLEED